MQQKGNTHHYQNHNAVMELFVEQSQNCGVIMGKVSITPKKQMKSLKVIIEIKGMYRIWGTENKNNNQNTESKIVVCNQSETLSDFDGEETKPADKDKLTLHYQLERQEYFLEGKQKIAQIDEHDFVDLSKPVPYPFLFNVPNKLPASLQEIWFAGKRIEIKYFLNIQGYEQQNKTASIGSEFDLQIRQASVNSQNEVKICKTIKYQCFTRCFCMCLGTYQIEFHATVLRSGQLQVEGRLFRQGKATEKIINGITIILMGELKNVKRMAIAEKKMVLHLNEFQMLEGQLLLSYSPDLHSFESELLTIRFWIECHIDFKSNIWKIKKDEHSADIIL